MGEFIFNDLSIPCLKKGMDTYALRQKVIANNIANLTPPGFHARKVKPRVVKEGTGYFNGTNDVNIDKEMANLAQTTIAFDAAAKLLYVKYQILQKSIRGR